MKIYITLKLNCKGKRIVEKAKKENVEIYDMFQKMKIKNLKKRKVKNRRRMNKEKNKKKSAQTCRSPS